MAFVNDLKHFILGHLEVDPLRSSTESLDAILFFVVVLFLRIIRVVGVEAPAYSRIGSAGGFPVIVVEDNQIVPIAEYRPHLPFVSDKVLLQAGGHVLLEVELKHECLPAFVMDVGSAEVFIPLVVRKSPDGLAVFGPNQNQSVFDMIALRVKCTGTEGMLRTPEEKLDFFGVMKQLLEKVCVSSLLSPLSEYL